MCPTLSLYLIVEIGLTNPAAALRTRTHSLHPSLPHLIAAAAAAVVVAAFTSPAVVEEAEGEEEEVVVVVAVSILAARWVVS